MTCPSCGLANPARARYCSNCGTALEAVRPVEGERKLVTVLFADVVGSTTMGERFDPEQIAEIMNGAFALFNAAVSRYGGTVARLLGDAVLAIFGAPVVHEDDAERAVLTGLAIQESAWKYGRVVTENYGAEFLVRVGINTGLAVLTTVGDTIHAEYTAMGDTANVAARMQSAARPGTVLVTADTYHFVKRLFDATPRGKLEVKGKAEPIETYEVVAPKAIPGKVRGLDGITSPLVGRDAELRLLRAGLEAATDGRGSFVAITGEAGLGKSRLVSEMRAWAASLAPSPTWLEGHAISYGHALAYFPWREIIREAIGARESDDPQVTREKLRTEWIERGLPGNDLAFLESLLGAESDATSAWVGERTRLDVAAGIANAVREYLATRSRAGPMVLVFDDLHWADEVSLELLASVADLVKRCPLMVVGMLRPDREAPSWETVGGIERALGEFFSRIDLEPLPEESSQMLLGNLLYVEELPESVRTLILHRSEGNPFFLEEVIRSLLDSGYIVREDGRWRATGDIVDVTIPDTLLGLLTARIDRLPDLAKRVAQVASVIGRTFPYDVLAALCSRAPDSERIADPRKHLEILAMEELVREWARDPELEYIFKHALTQEAAYDLLLLRRRKEYHRRVGEVMEALYPQRLDELAPLVEHHAWLGEDWARAAHYASRAGIEAERVAALREAANHFERAYEALKKLPDTDKGMIVDAITGWVRTAYKLAPVELVLGRLREAEALSRALAENRRLALTLNWIGNFHFYLGIPSGGIPALAEGDRLAKEMGDETLVLAWTFIMTESLTDQNPRVALTQLDHVIELARRNHYEDIEAHATGIKAMTLARLGEFSRAQETLQHGLAVVRQIHSPVKESDVLSAGAHMYFDMGQIERGIQASTRAAELALSVGGYECAVYSLYCIGMGYLTDRAWDQTVTAFEKARDQGESSRIGSEWLKNRIRAGLAMARAQSDSAGAIDEMKETLARAHSFEDDYTAALLSHALGRASLQAGDFDRAQGYLDDALAYYRRNGMRPYLPAILSSVADLNERRGQPEGAAAARAEAGRVAAELVA